MSRGNWNNGFIGNAFLLWKLAEFSVSVHHRCIVHFAIILCVMAKRFEEALNESESLKRLQNSGPMSTG